MLHATFSFVELIRHCLDLLFLELVQLLGTSRVSSATLLYRIQHVPKLFVLMHTLSVGVFQLRDLLAKFVDLLLQTSNLVAIFSIPPRLLSRKFGFKDLHRLACGRQLGLQRTFFVQQGLAPQSFVCNKRGLRFALLPEHFDFTLVTLARTFRISVVVFNNVGNLGMRLRQCFLHRHR